MNLIFMPMFVQGLAGMNRRLYDGGLQYALNRDVVGLHLVIGRAAWTMGLFQLPFIANFFWSAWFGRRSDENPWEATTLEWASPSPPAHGNFLSPPIAYRGPYAIQRRRRGGRFHAAVRARGRAAVIPYTVERRPDTGLYNAQIGIWLFIASEVMLFGALFSGYALLRTGTGSWPHGWQHLNVALGAANTLVLVASSAVLALGVRSLRRGLEQRGRRELAITCVLGVVFLALKGFEYREHLQARELPSTDNFFAVYFTLTGLHALHVIGGLVVLAYLIGPGWPMMRAAPARFIDRAATASIYWQFVDIIWILVFATVYLL